MPVVWVVQEWEVDVAHEETHVGKGLIQPERFQAPRETMSAALRKLARSAKAATTSCRHDSMTLRFQGYFPPRATSTYVTARPQK